MRPALVTHRGPKTPPASPPDLSEAQRRTRFSLRDRPGFEARVWASRAIALVLAAALAAHWDAANAALDSTWHVLRQQWWFQHDSFEPVCATLAFAFWLNFFGVVSALPLRHYLMDPDNRVVDHHTGVPYRYVLCLAIGTHTFEWDCQPVDVAKRTTN